MLKIRIYLYIRAKIEIMQIYLSKKINFKFSV